MFTHPRRTAGTILSAMLFAVPMIAAAQTLMIRPALIDAANTVEQALITHKGHASTTVTGHGGLLLITYQSTEPLEIYMVPLNADNTFVPTDFIRFTLPQSAQGTVAIDVTVSPGWSLKDQKWILHLLSTDEKAGAGFTDIHFEEQPIASVFSVVLGHLFTAEPYTPSSYHALRGYRVLGTSLTIMLGLLLVAAAGVCLLAFGKEKRPKAVLTALIAGCLVYQARFSVDLLRFTQEHLTGYAHADYDEAGSIHTVASVIRGLNDKAAKPLSVYVCRDGTNFKEKLLRYFTYPVRVSADKAMAASADFAVVMDKFKWGYQTTVSRDGTSVQLKCGDIDRPAVKVAAFPDTAVLFRLLPSSPLPAKP